MRALDPSWLRVELDAIEREQHNWDRALKASYDVAVQRVFEFQDQARLKEDDRKEAR